MHEKPEVLEPQANHHGGLLTFLILIVLYALGIGPAAWLHHKVPSTRPAIEAVYAPLTTAAEHSEGFRSLMRSYIKDIWQLPYS